MVTDPSLQSIIDFADDLIEFADSGLIDNVRDLSPLFTSSSYSIYRGLYLPKEWLCSGFVIEEWTGSTHWTKSESVAKRYSTSMDGEDFMLEYGEDKGLYNLSEILPLFEPVILVMNQSVRSLDLGNYLDLLEKEGYDVGSHFLSGKNDEQEVSVIGYDFRIDSVENKEGQCYVTVFPLDRNREVELETQKQSLDDKIRSASSRAAEAHSIDKTPAKEFISER